MRKIINDKIEDILNTTSMQQWYYNLYKERKDMKSLMMDLEFEFLGTIDLDILTESWKLVLEKYPMLRTVFYETKKHELFQVIYKNCSPEIDSVNWRGIAAYRQEVLGRNLRIEQEKRGVDLQVAPLLKFYLIQKNSKEFSFRWYFPILLMDGWNVPILYKDLIYYYSSLLAGKNPGVILESSSMKQYILYQRDRDKSEDKIFWREYLSASENLILPKQKNFHFVDFQKIEINLSDIEHEIRENAKKIGVSLNCVFQLSYMLALAQLQNKKRVYSRTTVADRPLAIKNIHNRVGLYINEIPIKLDIKEHSFVEMAKQLQNDLNQVFSHVSSSLEEISSFVGNRSLLEIDNTITFENMPMEDIDYSSLPFSLSKTNFINHPFGKIHVFIWPNKNMNIKFLYDSNTYSIEEMLTMGNKIKNTLKFIH